MLSRLRVSISKVSRTPFSTIATRLSSAWVTLMSMALDMKLLGAVSPRPPRRDPAGALLNLVATSPAPHRDGGQCDHREPAGFRPRAARSPHLVPGPGDSDASASPDRRREYSPFS